MPEKDASNIVLTCRLVYFCLINLQFSTLCICICNLLRSLYLIIEKTNALYLASTVLRNVNF